MLRAGCCSKSWSHINLFTRKSLSATHFSTSSAWCRGLQSRVTNRGRGHQVLYPRSVQAHRARSTMAEESVAVSVDPKLTSIRELMKLKGGYNALVVPTTDPHLLEYAPAHLHRRMFLTGFTGSAGIAIVTMDQALLWTDGRYFLQAENELGPDWTLMKAGTPKCPRVSEWLCKEMKKGDKIAIDPSVHPQSQVKAWKDEFARKGMDLVSTDTNLVDEVWGDAQPSAPTDPVRIHPDNLAGESVSSKLERIRTDMKTNEAQALFVAKLEEIGWILNLRGNDDPYTPIFTSYLLINEDSATLFIDPKKVPSEVQTYLSGFSVAVKPYEEAQSAVSKSIEDGTSVWINPDLVNASVFKAASDAQTSESNGSQAGQIVSKDTPITGYMAEKNEKEVDGMKRAHLRDAVAIIEFLAWFEKEIASGRTLTEVDVDLELTARRAQQPGYVSLSFPTIAGANSNGAVIHYQAAKETCKTVDSSTMLLIDSGGQYDCGTTDITRTFHLGNPSDHQKLCFTKVLQGHIGLALATFPEDTPGIALDILARGPLWKMGLDYAHGTGHGVGAHMSVHEGPISISHRYSSSQGQKGLKAGMVVSNEPGYYEDGNFGCRIENLVLVKEAVTPHASIDKKYLEFETISFVPMQKKMMNEEIMSTAEKQWVNEYHSQVWEKVSSEVSDAAREWLKESTAPITVR